MHPLLQHPLRHLFTLPGGRSRRASSWDRTGGNHDFIRSGSVQAANRAPHSDTIGFNI